MKLALLQVFCGLILLAAIIFFVVALLPDLLHVVLPPEEGSDIIRSIDINGGFILPAWILVQVLLSCAVIVCGIFQFKREKK